MSDDRAPRNNDDMSLAELVNRVLDRGALINGEVVIGVAGVDLIYLGLQIAISSVESMEKHAARTRLRSGSPGDDSPPSAGGPRRSPA